MAQERSTSLSTSNVYEEATAALRRLRQCLEDRNQSEARSLVENMEEMLTLHRLEMLGSFKTTNYLDSINLLEKPRSCINSSTARELRVHARHQHVFCRIMSY